MWDILLFLTNLEDQEFRIIELRVLTDWSDSNLSFIFAYIHS